MRSFRRTTLQSTRPWPHLFEVDVYPMRQNTAALASAGRCRKLHPIFVQDVTAEMMAGRGDQLPVSKLPVDGTYPTGTSQWEKRSIAQFIPEWLDEECIQCSNCSFVCPHAAIRAKFCHEDRLEDAPESFQSSPINARGFPEMRYVLQVYPDDCTGCNLCVDACPVRRGRRRWTGSGPQLVEKDPILEDAAREPRSWFEKLEWNKRSEIDFSNVRGVQYLQPLIRVLRRLHGLRRDPVPEAHHPVVWRPDDGRQCHRLFLHLWR